MKRHLQHLLPESLKEVTISRDELPTRRDSKQLPYHGLDAGQFELFCCELIDANLEKDFDLGKIVRIEPLAGDGHAQYGADIFIEKHSENGTSVELIEVKRVASFDKNTYEASVKRLIKNLKHWNYKITKFTVISSKQLSADAIKEMKNLSAREELSEIDLDIWPASKLDRMLEGNERLVFKYFHPIWTGHIFGIKTQEHFEKYGIYEFEESASWIDYDAPSEIEMNDSIIIRNDHVRIFGFLPTLRRDSVSCQIELRNGRFSHVLTTLSHKQLVDTYFMGIGTPLEVGVREFLTPHYNQKSFWICDIGNCRITIGEAEASCLCKALDQYAASYEKRLRAREDAWRIEGFAVFRGFGSTVPLITIKRGLWRIIRQFAAAHDVLETDDEWSIFDSSGELHLKVLTRKPNPKYDPGFHVFIRPREPHRFYENFINPDDDVLLAWCPPQEMGLNQFDGRIGPRYYWDATTTYDWLTTELVPEVLEWHHSLQRSNKKRRAFGFLDTSRKNSPSQLNISGYYSTHRNRTVDRIADINTIDQLRLLARRLQSFFSAKSSKFFVSTLNYRATFEALGRVLEFSDFDNFRYLKGNLGYLERAIDIKTLLDEINLHAKNYNDYCVNSFRMDCIFRCFDVILESNTCRLNDVEAAQVAKLLDPLVQQVQRTELFYRQGVRLAQGR